MQNLGIMVTNRCPAACAHCLYASSPKWENTYITRQKICEVGDLLEDFRIDHVHIGGGEPFLDFDGLCDVLDVLWDRDIDIDYVETNGFWCDDETRAREKIQRAKSLRAHTLMVSCDPFHARFIPVGRVVNFVTWCEDCRMDYFVWHNTYLAQFMRNHVPMDRPLTDCELEQVFGTGYREKTAREYGLAFNGRALGLLENMVPKRPARELIGLCRTGIDLSTGHIDPNGIFLPRHCLGFGVDLKWALEGGKPGRYPIVDLVREKGLRGLYALCKDKGFREDPAGYTSPCALCMELKRFLLPMGYEEIYPAAYFDNL